MLKVSLKDLAKELGAELSGNPIDEVDGCATLDTAKKNQLSFIYNKKYLANLKTTNAGVVILPASFLPDCTTNALVVTNPYFAYAQAATLMSVSKVVSHTIHRSVVIGENCRLPELCEISANVVLGDNVSIGEGAKIGPGCVIENDAIIGANAYLHANVTVSHQCQLGDRAIVHSGAVIGSDGFGFAPMPKNKGWFKIPQLGRVIIGDDVEIGANTAIDRGTLEDTVIGQGVKIDNQVMIAHNVNIGDHTAIAACVGIAGSTHIGKRCTFAGGIGVVGHIHIADDVHISGMSRVTNSIREAGIYSSGTPLQKNSDWRKNAVRFKQLDKLFKKVDNIIKKGK